MERSNGRPVKSDRQHPFGPGHASVPNSEPTPAVSAMASAPQNVTRIAPNITAAPPARGASKTRLKYLLGSLLNPARSTNAQI